MTRVSSVGAKADLWRSRLAQFHGSGQTVYEFCQQLGCSVSTFYYWKEKTATQTSVRCRRNKSGTAARFVELRVSPSSSHGLLSAASVTSTNDFSVTRKDADLCRQSDGLTNNSCIHVRTPDGVRLRLPVDATATLLAVLAQIASGQPGSATC